VGTEKSKPLENTDEWDAPDVIGFTAAMLLGVTQIRNHRCDYDIRGTDS
jgi:hypothetical protein